MDDMNELFDVEVGEKDRRKGAFLWFRRKFSGAQALAISLASILALSTPVVLLASRNNSLSTAVESTLESGGYAATSTTVVGESSTTTVSGSGKKSSTAKKPGLVLPTRGVAPTATTAPTVTTIATNESSSSTVVPPAPPIVLAPPTTIAPGSVLRTLSFDVTAPVLKTYGDVAFTVSPATPSVGGGEVTYSTSNAAACVVSSLSGEVSILGAGTCEISASVPASGTYAPAVTSTNVSIAVTKAKLTITASSASIAFSPRRYVATASYSGFVNGEDSSVLTALPTCEVLRPSDFETSSNDRNTYATSCTGAVTQNYDISYVGGVLTVSNWK
jgi:hypothetical protein